MMLPCPFFFLNNFKLMVKKTVMGMKNWAVAEVRVALLFGLFHEIPENNQDYVLG